MLVYLDCADESLVFFLNDSRYFGFGLVTFNTCGYRYFDAVAVERVHRVALGNTYFLAVSIYDNAVVAVAASYEYAFGCHRTPRRGAVKSGRGLYDVSVESELGEI